MKSLYLKPRSRARALEGHPWAFAGEMTELLPESYNGKSILLRDSKNHILGSGIYNSKSKIVWRRYAPGKQAFSMEWIRGALNRAIDRRAPASSRRLVWSESDKLPGLIVDQFEDVLVVQALTLAIDMRLAAIADALAELLNPRAIIFRNDAPVRELEGLAREVTYWKEQQVEPGWFEVGGIRYFLDLVGGQKTGFYLDQRDEHAWIRSMAEGRRVLDAFCNQGAFALNAAQCGARSVMGIDSSGPAVEAARRNAAENGLQAEFVEANVFDYFTGNREEQFDLVVLDPPPFAKSKGKLEGALRGYKEINLRGIKALAPGGILATYTCSQAVTPELFRQTVAEAAWDAKRSVRILRETRQAADHAVLLGMPESAYLHGLILEVD